MCGNTYVIFMPMLHADRHDERACSTWSACVAIRCTHAALDRTTRTGIQHLEPPIDWPASDRLRSSCIWETTKPAAQGARFHGRPAVNGPNPLNASRSGGIEICCPPGLLRGCRLRTAEVHDVTRFQQSNCVTVECLRVSGCAMMFNSESAATADICAPNSCKPKQTNLRQSQDSSNEML
jgi:hypothetical protein